MNAETLKGKWNEIKGEIRSQWGDLSESELEQSKGNMTSIAGLLQQKYGAKKEEIQGKLDSILAKFNDKSEDVKADLRNSDVRDDRLH